MQMSTSSSEFVPFEWESSEEWDKLLHEPIEGPVGQKLVGTVPWFGDFARFLICDRIQPDDQ
jgi:hypothetical protein